MGKNNHRRSRLGSAAFIPAMAFIGCGLMLFHCSAGDSVGQGAAALAAAPAEAWDLGLVTIRRDTALSEFECGGVIVSADWVLTGRSNCWSNRPSLVQADHPDGTAHQRKIVAGVRLQGQSDISMVRLAPVTADMAWPAVTRVAFSGDHRTLTGVEATCYWARALGGPSSVAWSQSRRQVADATELELIFNWRQSRGVGWGDPCIYNSQVVGVYGNFVYKGPVTGAGANSSIGEPDYPFAGTTGVAPASAELHYVATSRYVTDISDLVSEPKTIVHAPNGNFSQSHDDTFVRYVSDAGENWCAKIHGSTFLHARDCNWADSHSAPIISYRSWDNTAWTATLSGTRFTHAPGGDFTKARSDAMLNYQIDGANWTMIVR